MRFLKPLFKIAISLALIAIVLHAFDVKGVAAHFAKVDAATLMVVVAIALALTPLHTARWLAVVRAAEAALSFRTALQVVLIGHFFNQALPSSVGGDVVRMWCAYRAGLSMRTAVATVVIDRMLTLFSLLLLTAACLPWLFDVVADARARWALATVLIAGIAGFGSFLALQRLPHAVAHWRVMRALLSVAALGRSVMLDMRYALTTILLSVLSFVAFSLIVFYLADAMQLGITLLDCVLLVPPVILVSILPISIAGWGVREGAMVVAFGFINVPPGAAFAVSVLFGLTLAAASLPGALLWWLSGYSIKNVAAEAGDLAMKEPDTG